MPRTLRFTLALLLLWTTGAWAQKLSPAQYATLKNDILVVNQAEMAPLVSTSNFQALADVYNAIQSPTYWVWRSTLSEKDIYESTSPDSTTWSWATYKGQTVQERDSWNAMVRPGTINPSLAQTRAAFANIFGGQGASAQQNAFLLALSRRPARRIEAVLHVTTLGDGTAGNPANMGYEGLVSYQDMLITLTQTP